MKRLLLGVFLFTACSSGSSNVQAPTISTFTATPPVIAAGQSSKLTWSVTGTNPIITSINQGIGEQSKGSVSVSPSSTTTYTLSASNSAGSKTKDVTVKVQTSNPTGQLAAFPGAEGFGASATGGRGGKVIYVTNLNADGPGSLQAALDESGPRTILFKVSGIIEGVPIAQHGDFTLAGQSSPGGIILRGLMLQGDEVCEADDCPLPTVTPENFIIRFIRLRNPLPDGSDGDGLRLHHAKNGIIDHVSIGGATDEAMQVSFSSDITIQNSLLAETVGEHVDYGGMLLNYSDPARAYPLTRLSIHHNMWNRIVGRLPEISRESPGATGSVMELELSNNLAYDPGAAIWFSNCSITGGAENGYATNPVYYHANIVGNYHMQNPSRETSFGSYSMECALPPSEGYLPSNTQTRFFMQDNQNNLGSGLKDFQLFYCCNDFAQAALDKTTTFPDNNAPFKQNERFAFPPISYTASSDLTEYLLANVGAFPRDAMDKRLLGFVNRSEFDSTSRDTNPASDALTLPFTTPPAAPADTDNDGIPDDWESAHGLNPNQNDGNETGLSKVLTGVEGYTNLEVYLDMLAQKIMTE
ncbi:MAG: hypothetical protein KC422_25430 [Trueperaceae bacterium]|nr:hypothetical protein [Trueperaceae bacterium]